MRETADGDDGRGAHPEGALRVSLLEADADLEPIGQTYPVQGAPHLRKYEFALALLTASQEAYESTLESYRSAGLATVRRVRKGRETLGRPRTLPRNEADDSTARHP